MCNSVVEEVFNVILKDRLISLNTPLPFTNITGWKHYYGMKIPWNFQKRSCNYQRKLLGSYFHGSTRKNGNLGVALCNGCPLYILCGLVWRMGRSKIHRGTPGTDKGQTEQTGRVPDSLYGFLKKLPFGDVNVLFLGLVECRP